ncbi:oxalurate catabolism protein HpxZ [Serratia proteamaculans]|uniref:Oxalurate catabolism protein HpxZ n=1 Tax=Serratia proteamaculans TaxID=28151 RepID=A0A7U0N8J7_SERPR|nr:oxalurate catabolism protein HpxZ [Serratia proteamaculans]MBO1501500.1 oxalurate catabolism protein HpxZ [Serratia proteamaculans]MDW5509418.1 oxalurate catabolism protein HpxZ [Serratia proteamaculans]QQX54501.1 oxalurate catabolism protein HpxZ [Serratia proteamaculans]
MKSEYIDRPAVLAEVNSAFYRYEQALIGNDIEVLDELFWHDGRTVRYGATENLYGIDQIRDFRQQRPSKGLDRLLENTVITTYGDDMAVASTEFRRPGSDRLGRQMQTWVKLPCGWRIVAAHVSLMG